jgi:hypothetical protein
MQNVLIVELGCNLGAKHDGYVSILTNYVKNETHMFYSTTGIGR